jgi:hypothetical protein
VILSQEAIVKGVVGFLLVLCFLHRSTTHRYQGGVGLGWNLAGIILTIDGLMDRSRVENNMNLVCNYTTYFGKSAVSTGLVCVFGLYTLQDHLTSHPFLPAQLLNQPLRYLSTGAAALGRDLGRARNSLEVN